RKPAVVMTASVVTSLFMTLPRNLIAASHWCPCAHVLSNALTNRPSAKSGGVDLCQDPGGGNESGVSTKGGSHVRNSGAARHASLHGIPAFAGMTNQEGWHGPCFFYLQPGSTGTAC